MKNCAMNVSVTQALARRLRSGLPMMAGIACLIGISWPGYSFLGQRAADQRAPISWRVQRSGTEASLRGVSAVDDKTAWAGGGKGTILRTTDGGETWTSRAVPGAETTDFRDVEAFSAETACVMGVGRPAKIFKTTDGGTTWTERYHNDAPGIFLDAIAFFDEKNGLAVGDPMDGRFFLIYTANGGTTWEPVPFENRPEARQGEGAFAAGGTCLFVMRPSEAWFCTGGPVARVMHSADKGKTWQAAPSPLLSGQASFGAFSVAFLDRKNGIIAGGDYKDEAAREKNAALSTDGGRTWELTSSKPPAGFRECVAFVPKTTPPLAVAVGPSGSDYSLDMGRTWNPIAGPAGFHSVSFSKSGKAGWAVGKGGLIARFALAG
ncbi:MAG: YCF48-related protein [Candidatus Aminicenantales bacterium]